MPAKSTKALNKRKNGNAARLRAQRARLTAQEHAAEKRIISAEELARLYRLAADSGDAYAQFNLGVMYQNGQGVEQSYQEAARLYRLSADSGNAFAQGNLGYLYNRGLGVEQSLEEAVRLYTSAAKAGNKAAIKNLADLYREGLGVEKDLARAKLLLRQAGEAEGAKVFVDGVSHDLRERAQSDLASIKESCASCGAKRNGFKQCVRCHGPRYCGRKCQKADWPQHKRVCRSKADTAAMLRDALDFI